MDLSARPHAIAWMARDMHRYQLLRAKPSLLKQFEGGWNVMSRKRQLNEPLIGEGGGEIMKSDALCIRDLLLQRLQRTTLHSLTNYNAIGSKITDRWLQCVQYELLLLLLGALAGWKWRLPR
jgi:hypothetical protein